MVWVEEEEEVKVKVKDEEEWVAADWARPEIADARIAAIQCRIKRGCHAISRLAQNVGLK
ncbi:MAG: hypothetical protein U9N61_04480 [Euryarchaeota archaeon]|nr:hypothetical protein [Euryarchaeota archaeon]